MMGMILNAMRGKKSSGPIKMLTDLLAMTGMKLDAKELERDQLESRFKALVRTSLPSDVTVLEIQGAMPDGSVVSGLIVMTPARPSVAVPDSAPCHTLA